MKFKIITLGCKVNTYESEYMLEALVQAGYKNNEKNPDIIIVNTCSVTNMADNKSLKIVRKARRENPQAILVVCGCSVQNAPEKYQDLDISILIGNKNKNKVVTLINNYLENKENYTYFTQERDLEFESMEVKQFSTHTRAFIKIQDGCNNFCSYCIIPYTRGSIRSKKYLDVLSEAKTLVENNHQEIVLTGIHTGSYFDDNKDFSDLLVALAKIPDLKRIRISSIEITELNAKFLKTLKDTPKICNHLHIPLQSGSDTVLKRMNRKYDTAYFRQKISAIREIRPNISITTDCIVGHPYETDQDFQEYLSFCEEIKFSKIHVFPYSIRTGTPASLMPQVDGKIKKERAQKLITLSNKLETEYINKFKGMNVEVLTEEYYQDYVIGHTDNYLKVYLKGDYQLNNIYLCKITKVEEAIAYAQVVSCQTSEISI